MMTTEQRLNRLEKHLHLFVALVVLLWGWNLVRAFLPKGTIRVANVVAGNVVLQDKHGRQRAELCMYTNAGPGLSLFDEHGKRRVGLVACGDVGPLLTFYDQSENARALLHLDKELGPKLVFVNASGRKCVQINTLIDQPEFELYDAKGRPRVVVYVDRDTGPGLSLWDESSKAVWEVPSTRE